MYYFTDTWKKSQISKLYSYVVQIFTDNIDNIRDAILRMTNFMIFRGKDQKNSAKFNLRKN